MAVWKCAAIDRLLSHIQNEADKGLQSQYLLDQTKARNDLAQNLKEDFGMDLTGRQIENKINGLWQTHRKSEHQRSGRTVLFKKGRGALDIYTDPRVLQLRPNELGTKTPDAKDIVKRLGLSDKRKRDSDLEHPSEAHTSAVTKKRSLGMERTLESAGNAKPTTTTQRLSQGEETSSTVATPDNMIPSARKPTVTGQTAVDGNPVQLPKPAPLSAEPGLPGSIDRRGRLPKITVAHTITRSIPVAPSHSLATLTPAGNSITPPSPSPITPPPTVPFPEPVDRLHNTECSHNSRPGRPPHGLTDDPVPAPSSHSRFSESAQRFLDFMSSDPRQYLPTHSDMRKLSSSVSDCIGEAVCKLLDGTGTDLNKSADVIPHKDALPFLQLCKPIYGVNSTDAVCEKVFLVQIRSLLPLGEFLCSVVAAAVHDWVLKGEHVLRPGLQEKTDCTRLMEKCIKDVVSPDFLDRLTLKMNYDYAQTLRETPPDLEQYPKTLSRDLLTAVNPFLRGNLTTWSDTTWSESTLVAFRESLSEVFSKALKLMRQQSLQAEELYFKWVDADVRFDPTFMKEKEECASANPQEPKTVQVRLSPALVKMNRSRLSSDDAGEMVVYPALVSLQRSYRGRL